MTTIERKPPQLLPGSGSPRATGGALRTHSILPSTLLIVILTLLVIFPLGILVSYAFRDKPLYQSGGAWSLESWSVLAEPGALHLIFNSLGFVVSAIITSVLLGLPTTWLLEQAHIRGARIWRALVIASMALSPGITAFVWLLLAQSPGGALTEAFAQVPLLRPLSDLNIQSIPGMGFVAGIAMTPTIYTILAPSMSRIGSDMLEASYMSGASVVSAVRYIAIPLIRPATMGALLIVALTLIGTLEIPLIVGSAPGLGVFASHIYNAMNQSYGLPNANVAAVFGLILLVIAIVLLTLYYKTQSQSHRFTTITGKGGRAASVPLGRWQSAAQVYLAIVLTLILVLPIATLLYASAIPYFRAPTQPGAFSNISFSVYGEVLSNDTFIEMLKNTVVVGLLSACLVVAIGTAAAWISAKRLGIAGFAVSILAFLPIGIPTVLIATSISLTYIYINIPILGTNYVLILAYVTTYMSFSFMFMRAAVGQIDADLEDASRMSNARGWQTVRFIIAPLLLPALASTWVWIFAHVARDMTIAPVLGGPHNPVIGSYLWSQVQNGNVQVFAAVSILMTGALFVVVLAWQLLSPRR